MHPNPRRKVGYRPVSGGRMERSREAVKDGPPLCLRFPFPRLRGYSRAVAVPLISHAPAPLPFPPTHHFALLTSHCHSRPPRGPRFSSVELPFTPYTHRRRWP